MSKDWFADMEDFHSRVMLDAFPRYPHIPDEKFKSLRKKLIIEEVEETLTALDKGDVVEIADGIVDSIVVLLGTAITYGIDIRPIWDEIHRTNMGKAKGRMREDGKRLKPVGWKPPRVLKLLRGQGYFGLNKEL